MRKRWEDFKEEYVFNSREEKRQLFFILHLPMAGKALRLVNLAALIEKQSNPSKEESQTA